MSGNPTDIGGTPVDIGVVEIENPFGGDVAVEIVSACGVDYAFGLARAARGIEDE
jgi:hypothetical protein